MISVISWSVHVVSFCFQATSVVEQSAAQIHFPPSPRSVTARLFFLAKLCWFKPDLAGFNSSAASVSLQNVFYFPPTAIPTGGDYSCDSHVTRVDRACTVARRGQTNRTLWGAFLWRRLFISHCAPAETQEAMFTLALITAVNSGRAWEERFSGERKNTPKIKKKCS